MASMKAEEDYDKPSSSLEAYLARLYTLRDWVLVILPSIPALVDPHS